ncbi:MAG: hypothetical protein U0M72_02125 [Eggerthellaceae bacterium]
MEKTAKRIAEAIIVVFIALSVIVLTGCSNIEQAVQKSSSPSATLEEITADFESTSGKLTEELEKVNASAGTTYEEYAENKQLLTDWYALVLSESESLFARTKEKSADYFRAVVATVDHADSSALQPSMKEYYRTVYDDAMTLYYRSVYDDAFQNVYRTYHDGVMKDAYKKLSYSEYSDVNTALYREYSDAQSDCYRVYSDAQSEYYQIYSDVMSKFYEKDFDIESALE